MKKLNPLNVTCMTTIGKEVQQDIEDRIILGNLTRGPKSTCDPLEFSYQEALDLTMYLKAKILERDGVSFKY